MNKTRDKTLYCIAGHYVEVAASEAFDRKRLLPSFEPFKSCPPNTGEIMCSVRVVEKPVDIGTDSVKVLSEVSGLLGHWFCLMEAEQCYIADIQFVENGNRYRMFSDKTFSANTVYVDPEDKYAGIVLSSFLMIIFAQSAVLNKTLFLHASVVEKDGRGYAFLGKSGTGKSTHSSLWLRYVEGAGLLNDDNPAIRMEEDGSVCVYGTPWSGKTPCYKNRRVPLMALVRLEQAPANRFTWKEGVDALTTLLPSCSSMRWNALLYTKMCDLLEEVVGKVKVGCLECLPDKEAALLCYEEMGKL